MKQPELNAQADRIAGLAADLPKEEWAGTLRREVTQLPAAARDLVLTASVVRVLEDERGACSYPVWYATDREPASNRNYYSVNRVTGGAISYGICQVTIPESHKLGSTGSPWWKQFVKRPDGKLKIRECSPLDEPSFWRTARERLQGLLENDRGALVFIHGFNVTFKWAALRAAQLGVDLKIPLSAFFSWPSRGSLHQYLADTASIESSEQRICGFLKSFMQQSGAKHVHVIAHSMGNQGLLRSFQAIGRGILELGPDRFGQIILAAPDVDSEVFSQFASAYPPVSRRTTLYVSSNDRALRGSGILHNAPRAGFAPPITIVPDIDTVEVSAIDISKLGHGYFASARPLLSDIHALIHSDLPPTSRIGLIHSQDNGRSYWRFQA